MKQGHHQIPYQTMPVASRFGVKSWLHYDETCYTEEELQLREQLIKVRAASLIHKDLLVTDNNWFNPDRSQAFNQINPDSWVLPQLLKPKKIIATTDFHIPLVENKHLKWGSLSTMMRNIGDYLLIRNKNLPKSQLNQPINYILLDLVQILRHLASRENGEFVVQELKHIAAYIRAVEIEISPMIGSDRLFLADSRRQIDEQVLPEVQLYLQSQFFKTQLMQIKNNLQDIAEQRHTLLHFSLIKNPVNEHPYLEYFIKPPANLVQDRAFPTIAAKACAEIESSAEELPSLKFTSNALRNCPNFQPIPQLPETTIDAYGQALSDVQEILRFQQILDKLMQLLDKSGEIFTIVKFNEQIMMLMQEMESFVRRSQQTISDIHDANSLLYHKSIYQKQTMHTYEKLLTSREIQLNGFIKNQDNLARFSVSHGELLKTQRDFIGRVNQFMADLKDQSNSQEQKNMLEGTKVIAQQLMLSMHSWMDKQCAGQGRSCEAVFLLPTPASTAPQALTASAPPTFFIPAGTSVPTVHENQDLSGNQSSCKTHSSQLFTIDFSLLMLISVILLLVKLIYDHLQKQNDKSNDPIVFKGWAIKVADQLALLNDQQDSEYVDDISLFNDQYQELMTNRKYDCEAMQELYKDLDYFLQEQPINKNGL